MTELSENTKNDQTVEPENTAKNYCAQCKSEIPSGAKLCVHCGSYQNKFNNHLKHAVIIVGFLAALGTAAMHSISLAPIVKTILLPNPDIKVIGFKSNQRLIVANTGNLELFISHVHYESNNIEYENIVKDKLAVVLDKPINDIDLNSEFSSDPFNTNEDVGVVLKPGKILKFDFNKDIPKGMSFVHGKTSDDWLQIVLIAGMNKKSNCIRPVFFSLNDRRFRQLKNNVELNLNIFSAKATIFAFSPQTGKEIEFPFEVAGTVTISQDRICTDRIKRWINPRRGHIEDLQ